ncbi:MAG: DNA-3-methyladenine glycosylase 2 family protein [bacterium]|nr:DNA-3-methyladenine glycosylase 2 family protein [bacterium]
MYSEQMEFEYRPRGPYSLALTASRFQRFPERVDRVDDSGYRRLMIVERQPLLVSVHQRGPVSRATLHVRMQGKGAQREAARGAAERVLERGLGARADLRAFCRNFKDDPLLCEPMTHFRGLRVAGAPDVWEALVTTVLCQQVNLKFAFSIRDDLIGKLGRRARFDGMTYYAFPAAERVARESETTLRTFRLTAAKARTIHALAQAFKRGELADKELAVLDDEQVIERLCQIKGVGRWTAEVVLIRGLARLDAYPAADLAVLKYLARDLLGRKESASEAEMRNYAKRWRPYRSLALVYALAELARRQAVKQAG